MRSEDQKALAALEADVMAHLSAVKTISPGITYQVEVVGDRPAGMIPLDHPLVHMAREALDATKTQAVFQTGSTDANLPLSRGIPAVTVGITTGGNSHRLDEFIDTAPIPRGMWQLVLLTLAASSSLHTP